MVGVDNGGRVMVFSGGMRMRMLLPLRLHNRARGPLMSNGKTYTGSCFCGAVQITVSGEPAGMGCCHCKSCRDGAAGPVNAFTLCSPEIVRITRGADNVGTYHKTEQSYRKWCKTCGGHIMTEHPGLGLTDVYAAVIPDLPFKPGLHENYAETVLHMKDGLPKL